MTEIYFPRQWPDVSECITEFIRHLVASKAVRQITILPKKYPLVAALYAIHDSLC